MERLLSKNPFDPAHATAYPSHSAKPIGIDIKAEVKFRARKEGFAIFAPLPEKLAEMFGHVGIGNGAFATAEIGQRVRDGHALVVMHRPNEPFVIHGATNRNIDQANFLINLPM